MGGAGTGSRSFGETADVTPIWAERASSGVGCSRNKARELGHPLSLPERGGG